MNEKDIIINLLMQQRNAALDAVLQLGVQIEMLKKQFEAKTAESNFEQTQ